MHIHSTKCEIYVHLIGIYRYRKDKLYYINKIACTVQLHSDFIIYVLIRKDDNIFACTGFYSCFM